MSRLPAMRKRRQEQLTQANSKRNRTSDDDMADEGLDGKIPVPRKIATEVERLKKEFHVDQAKLRKITQRFEEELEEGLRNHGKNMAMYVTWVLGLPTGNEKGEFLTLDLGGTNLRVCWIKLTGKKGAPEVKQDEYSLPDDLKTGSSDNLWDFITGSLEDFIHKQSLAGSDDDPLHLGFTFSYPVIQDRIDHGVLQTWTKGFDIKGVEKRDVAEQLRNAIKRKNLPVSLVALVNDTTGTLIASAYNDSETVIGAIFGTGCNAAYMEDAGSIPKLKGSNLSSDTQVAINCEYGAFDNARRVLPLTKYDQTVDSESPRPGEQMFEKMSAGLYLGEIFRLIIVELHEKSLVLKYQDVSAIQKPYSVDTAFISSIEEDDSAKLNRTAKAFQDDFNLIPSETELELFHQISEIISIRGAQLCACGVAAICKKKNIKNGHIAADGSVANKNALFRERWAQALSQILDWPKNRKDDPIIMTVAEDGSGIGAAVIAAMTIERNRNARQGKFHNGTKQNAA